MNDGYEDINICTRWAADLFLNRLNLRNYSGCLSTCQSRGNRLKYSYDERRRTASPARRKSPPQSTGRGTAALERAIGRGAGPDQGAGRALGTRQSHEQ